MIWAWWMPSMTALPAHKAYLCILLFTPSNSSIGHTAFITLPRVTRGSLVILGVVWTFPKEMKKHLFTPKQGTKEKTPLTSSLVE